MPADNLTRLLLAGILVALIALVVRGDPELPVGSEGAYQLYSERAGAPILFRIDTRSGRSWKMELRGGGDRWKPILEPDGSAPRADALATVPPPRPRAPAPAPTPTARPEDPAAPPAGPDAASAPLPDPENDVALLVGAIGRSEVPIAVRTWSLQRLGLIPDRRATEALLGALDDSDPVIVAAAARSLARKQDPRVAPALAKLADHADAAVREAAAALP